LRRGEREEPREYVEERGVGGVGGVRGGEGSGRSRGSMWRRDRGEIVEGKI
jgi:hypothetical protein